MKARPDKGPVQVLCEEVKFPFTRSIERTDVFVAFVRELLLVVDHHQGISEAIAQRFGAVNPTCGSQEALKAAFDMLSQTTTEAKIEAAGGVHDLCHTLNPEEMVPTNHTIDMVSSCASAIRFGLESGPCRSRHAAAAANHIWRIVYGISLHDSLSRKWSEDWACRQLLAAIVSLLPPATAPLDGESSA